MDKPWIPLALLAFIYATVLAIWIITRWSCRSFGDSFALLKDARSKGEYPSDGNGLYFRFLRKRGIGDQERLEKFLEYRLERLEVILARTGQGKAAGAGLVISLTVVVFAALLSALLGEVVLLLLLLLLLAAVWSIPLVGMIFKRGVALEAALIRDFLAERDSALSPPAEG